MTSVQWAVGPFSGGYALTKTWQDGQQAHPLVSRALEDTPPSTPAPPSSEPSRGLFEQATNV